ncbi:hypothetical protein [Streptomyces sp. NPDC002540]
MVDELGRAASLEVFEVAAEAYDAGHRAEVAELGAPSDDTCRPVDDITPQAQVVHRLAQETADRVTAAHRTIPRAAIDRFRAIVGQVAAIADPRYQDAPPGRTGRHADVHGQGVTAFRDRSGRRPASLDWPERHPSLYRGETNTPHVEDGPLAQVRDHW